MIRLIVAHDRRRGIAKRGIQPWSIPIDRRHFVDMTKDFGGTILVGSKTYRLLTNPLHERSTFVLTRQKNLGPDVQIVHDLDTFLFNVDQDKKDVWIIGGTSVYEAALVSGRVGELYVTEIDAAFGCDEFLPDYSQEYVLEHCGDWQEQNGFQFRFMKYLLKV